MQIIKNEALAAGKAVEALKNGGIVIYPTETMYGVGVDAENPEAVKKLIEYKNRPFGKPFSIAVTDEKMAEKYVLLNETAKKLYTKFLPGPLTIISKGLHKVAPGVESEDGTLGVRIPDFQLVSQIVQKLGKPVTATSANASYKKRPYKIQDVLENLSQKQKDLIGLIIDAGELPHNEPSSVIDTTLDEPVVLRQGKIKLANKNEITTRNEEATENLAKEIWQKYEIHEGKRAIIFALEGQMGAGKTIFTKGLAKALGITETVTSPTFALEQEYQIPKTNFYLHHFDAWRMTRSNELRDLDFEELISKKAVVSIEWAERVEDTIREFDDEAIIIWVNIKYGKKETDRIISWGVTE